MDDTNMMTLLVTAVIAGVLLFRLMSLLGTRQGHEAPPQPVTPAEGKVVPMHSKREEARELANLDDESRSVLDQLRETPAGFDLSDFMGGAKRAYEMLLMAYETGDKATLKPWLSPEVFTAFSSSIDQREQQGLRVEARFVGMRSAELQKLRVEQGHAEISIRFQADIISAMRDDRGEVVAGNPAEVQRISDLWTFARPLSAQEPKWLLVETSD